MHPCGPARFVFRVPLPSLCLILFAASNGLAQPAKNSRQNDAQPIAQNPQNERITEQQLRKKLAETGNDPFVLHQLGDVLYRQGKIREARKRWNEAAGKEPNLASAHVSVAMDLINKGHVKAAQIALKSAEKENANDPHLHVARANLAIRQGAVDIAEKEFRLAIGINPKLMATNIVFGQFAQRRGDVNAAEKYFKAAAEYSPDRPEGWLLLAALKFQKDEIAEAYNSLKKADATGIDEGLAEERLAGFYLRLKDLVGALKWYKQAAARKPKELRVRVALAQIKASLKMYDEARKDLQAIIKDVEEPAALIALAQLEQQNNNLEKAQELYLRTLKVIPNHVIANNNLAMLLMRLNRLPQEALAAAENARKFAPNNVAVVATYGCVLVHASRNKQAKPILSHIVRRLPSDAWVRYAYGKVLLSENQTETARDHLEGCLILDPDFPRKNEVEQLLKSLKSSSK